MTPGEVSSLALIWRTREGSGEEGNPSAIPWLDFVINGRSLGDLLEATAHDLIGCLGLGDRSHQDRLVRILLLETPPDLETGRVALYVCPLCGDIGHTGNTAVIEQIGEFVVWKEFGLERDYHLDDGPLFDLTGYENIGPFYFDKQQYREALTKFPTQS